MRECGPDRSMEVIISKVGASERAARPEVWPCRWDEELPPHLQIQPFRS